MSIQFNCRQCGKLLKAATRHAGKKAKCTGCGAPLIVPTPAAAEPAPVPEPTVQWQSADDEPPPPEATEDEDAPVLPPRKANEEEGVDMTAMVDVVFFLLIYFMTASLQSIAAGMQVPTPDPSKSAAGASRTVQQIEQDEDYVIVRIDKDNTVWVDDAQALSEQDLLSKLRAAHRGAAGAQGASKMMVIPSGDAFHETVVMVLDAGTTAGMEDLRLGSSTDD
jgi:biopolymer transport protein ExbD